MHILRRGLHEQMLILMAWLGLQFGKPKGVKFIGSRSIDILVE